MSSAFSSNSSVDTRSAEVAQAVCTYRWSTASQEEIMTTTLRAEGVGGAATVADGITSPLICRAWATVDVSASRQSHGITRRARRAVSLDIRVGLQRIRVNPFACDRRDRLRCGCAQLLLGQFRWQSPRP